MKRKSHSAYQHEPLVIPQDWQGQPRSFAIRLAQLLETLFSAQQRLSERVRALEEDKNAQISRQ